MIVQFYKAKLLLVPKDERMQRFGSSFNQCTVQTFTESEDNRCCVNINFAPEDGHVNARNMSKIIV